MGDYKNIASTLECVLLIRHVVGICLQYVMYETDVYINAVAQGKDKREAFCELWRVEKMPCAIAGWNDFRARRCHKKICDLRRSSVSECFNPTVLLWAAVAQENVAAVDFALQRRAVCSNALFVRAAQLGNVDIIQRLWLAPSGWTATGCPIGITDVHMARRVARSPDVLRFLEPYFKQYGRRSWRFDRTRLIRTYQKAKYDDIDGWAARTFVYRRTEAGTRYHYHLQGLGFSRTTHAILALVPEGGITRNELYGYPEFEKYRNWSGSVCTSLQAELATEVHAGRLTVGFC